MEESERKSIQSLLDLRSEEFNAAKPEETRQIAYDLDGDGVKDKVVGRVAEMGQNQLGCAFFE